MQGAQLVYVFKGSGCKAIAIQSHRLDIGEGLYYAHCFVPAFDSDTLHLSEGIVTYEPADRPMAAWRCVAKRISGGSLPIEDFTAKLRNFVDGTAFSIGDECTKASDDNS